jgi:predicted  nucleic acid-binding Zn-ribbon protein
VAGVTDALLALADHDEALIRARHDVAHPAAQADLDRAVASLASLAADASTIEAERAPLAARAEELERDATAARDRAAAIARRLDESTGAGRELEAMAHERDGLAARADAFDDELLAIYEVLGPLDERLATVRSDAEDVTARREHAARSVAEQRAAAGVRLDELMAARPALAEAIDQATLARYDAAAKHAEGTGAARLVNGRCGGCHVTVPAAIADRLAHAPEGTIAVCDECGRLLVR